MRFRSYCTVLVAMATLEVLAGWYVPLFAPVDSSLCDELEECIAEDETRRRDHVKSDPTLFFPFLISGKVDDDLSTPPAVPVASAIASPQQDRVGDEARIPQPFPRAPGIHVLCTYLS